MYRLILIVGLLIVLYFLLRSALRELRSGNKKVLPKGRTQDAKQMVQDPVCRVFIPCGEAIREEVGGQTYFFCSRDCAQAFQKQLSG
jgi:YHS domain-containing protein